MAIRRKKPGQPAGPLEQCVQPQCTKTNRVCKSYPQPGSRFVAASTSLRQQNRNESTETPKCSRPGASSLTASPEYSRPIDCTVHKGDENRSGNPTLPPCNGDSGKGRDGDEESSVPAEDSVCRLQSRLRDNWSKLVTDRITMMAFARSLKGHKCPTFLYCQS